MRKPTVPGSVPKEPHVPSANAARRGSQDCAPAIASRVLRSSLGSMANCLLHGLSVPSRPLIALFMAWSWRFMEQEKDSHGAKGRAGRRGGWMALITSGEVQRH